MMPAGELLFEGAMLLLPLLLLLLLPRLLCVHRTSWLAAACPEQLC
jgi:hypothetical protein